MGKILYTPQINHYIHTLGDRQNYYSDSLYQYDKKAYKDIDKIFELLEKISPVTENGCRELWFRAERGSIEQWEKYEDLYELGEVENREEYEDLWLCHCPKEVEWYNFTAVEDKEIQYRAVLLGNRPVIVIDPKRQKGFELEISDLTGWLVEQIQEAIKKLEDGTYMDYVRDNLPPEHKTGTIKQKYLWEMYPHIKEELFKGLTDNDLSEFVAFAEAQCQDWEENTTHLDSMTAGDFFRFCAMGYKAMGYTDCDKTPKEQYKSHADGRDDGLLDLDIDSADAFEEWLTSTRMRIGHPFEVCRGGNSTHISLYPHKDENGYFLRLDGSSEARSNETMKFYLALCRAGIPVYLSDADVLIDRVKGEEKVGVVPQGIIPKYRHMDFPKEKVISFMNLPYDEEEKVAKKCVWQDITEVHLL
ncbi:MAG: hypothetical protein K5768_09225 [Firmicutes bacterium]|nr:hypothetical protein [Bacillota bacterium]